MNSSWCLQRSSSEAVPVCFLFRGCSFLSTDRLAPFNGQCLNGGAWMEAEGRRSVHMKSYSEVTTADTTRLFWFKTSCPEGSKGSTSLLFIHVIL